MTPPRPRIMTCPTCGNLKRTLAYRGRPLEQRVEVWPRRQRHHLTPHGQPLCGRAPVSASDGTTGDR